MKKTLVFIAVISVFLIISCSDKSSPEPEPDPKSDLSHPLTGTLYEYNIRKDPINGDVNAYLDFFKDGEAEIYNAYGGEIWERSREKITYKLDRNKIFVNISYAGIVEGQIMSKDKIVFWSNGPFSSEMVYIRIR